MKRAFSFLLTACIFACAAASVRAQALPEGLERAIFTQTLYAGYDYGGYTCTASTYQAGDRWAACIISGGVGDNEHSEIQVVHDMSEDATRWERTACSTTAVDPQGSAVCTLTREEDGFWIEYKDERYLFEERYGTWALMRAYIGGETPLNVTWEDTQTGGWYLFESGGERTYWHAGYQYLNDFNISLFPRSVAEARHSNALCAGESRLSFTRSQLNDGGKEAVYAAPDEQAYRAANNRASALFQGCLYELACKDGWTLIYYPISVARWRCGWVKRASWECDLFYEREVITCEDTYLTDDPCGSQDQQIALAAGETLTGLCMLNAYYAYVSTSDSSGKALWGFVPVKALDLMGEQTAEGLARQMEGSWYLEAGGTFYADFIEFRSDGTYVGIFLDWEAPPPTDGRIAPQIITGQRQGMWNIEFYDPGEGIYFWNHPKYKLTIVDESGVTSCYGMTLRGDSFSLTDGEGSGGFRRCVP